jgi:hypothetical protein
LSAFSVDGIAGMAVSPLKQWVEVKPGEEAFFSVTVKNTNRGPETAPCTVYADVVHFTVSAYGQLSFGGELKHGRSAVDWIGLDANRFILQPGESKELRGKVSAPASADGDYWAAIMFTLGDAGTQKKNVNVILRTASGVFVRAAKRDHIEQTSIIDVNVSLPQLALEQCLTEESTSGQASEPPQTQCLFKINAELKNDGLVAIEPNGKVFLYAGNSRRIGSIPLYASRRQILPGHSRRFTGVMAQPLPPGQYRARVFFNSDSKYARTRTKDVEFSISQELATRWAQNLTGDDREMLQLNPQKIDLTLNPGRFTVAKLLVVNTGLGTVSVRCRAQSEQLQEDCMELECTEFALAPNTRSNELCAVRIPADAQPQDYNATIQIEVERSGLTEQTVNNVVLREIPVHILVIKHIGGLTSESGS